MTVRGPFFHGGVPGLQPGDKILPPRLTGVQRLMRNYFPPQVSVITHPWLMRDDLVFFSPDPDFAALFAGAYPDGAVYEVAPNGPVTLDPDTPAGEAWRAPSATVVRVTDSVVPLPRSLTREELAEWYGEASGITRRIVNVLSNEPAREATCGRGHVHWGQFNAAGLLLRHGGRYLLQERAAGTHHGGTWGIPGGALLWEEHPYTGAVREAVEEMGPLPALRPRVIGVDDHDGWTYSTVVADVEVPFMPSGGDGEGVAYRWCTEVELESLRLHPGLAESWPGLVTLMNRY
ncbi:NUDIX domain-containing protein [Streptomyces ardesiacus]